MPLLLMLEQCLGCVNFKLCQGHWGCTTPQLYHSENYMWTSFQLGMKMTRKVGNGVSYTKTIPGQSETHCI